MCYIIKRWSSSCKLEGGTGPTSQSQRELSVLKMSKRVSSFENAGKRYKYYYPEGLQRVGRLRILHWHCFACSRPQTRSWSGDRPQIEAWTWRAPELCRVCEQAYIALQARHNIEWMNAKKDDSWYEHDCWLN